MPEDTTQSSKKLNLQVDGAADIKGSAFGDENQMVSDVGKVDGHLVQAHDSDVHIGNKISGDRNVNMLGNLVIYLSSRPEEEAEAQPVSAEICPNPYKGLSAFSENDAGRFFGREKLIQQLWEKYRDLHEMSPTPHAGGPGLRLLAILGPSGSGKSSVARAGLLPELARQPLPGRKRARVAVFTPGSHPIRALAAILARIATNDPSPVAKTREFERELRRKEPSPPTPLPKGEGSLPLPLGEGRGEGYDGLSRIADVLPDIDTAPLLILVDQFEEVYSLCQDAQERRQMIHTLLNAAADASGRVSVILTLRSDFLGHTQSHPDLNHAIAAQGVIVPVMNDEELRQAIARPAELAGHPLEAAIIDLLIAQSAGREGALPLLQFALMRIWEGLAGDVAPAETLKAIGGVGGALAGEAQRLYDKLAETDKAIARRAFLALVQLGEGTRDTRRRTPVPDMIAHGEDPGHVAAVLRVFAQPGVRLVTLSADPQNGATAEVTHEALLTHWTSLKDWLDDLRFHRRVADATNYWDEQKRPDGLLWRPPDLDLLHDFQARAGDDMTPTQVQFFKASVRRAKHSQWLKRGAISVLIIFAAVAGIAAYLAIEAQNDTLVQSVVTHADQHFLKGEREQAALLARHAYFLNDSYQANIDDQVRDVLRRALALPEGETDEMIEQVCQQATRNLRPDEWQKVVKSDDIPYEPCSDLPGSDGAAEFVLRLRSKPVTTEERQHLSLYVKADGYAGTYINNRFEAQEEGKVVVDHATGLMWQQSGSDREIIYQETEQYVQELNDEKFAGYADWRLPTVEELLSLVEPERSSNKLYIDPLFDAAQSWVWSTDIRQIKDGVSSSWRVGFHLGLVYWNYVRYQGGVRCVRSGQ